MLFFFSFFLPLDVRIFPSVHRNRFSITPKNRRKKKTAKEKIPWAQPSPEEVIIIFLSTTAAASATTHEREQSGFYFAKPSPAILSMIYSIEVIDWRAQIVDSEKDDVNMPYAPHRVRSIKNMHAIEKRFKSERNEKKRSEKSEHRK